MDCQNTQIRADALWRQIELTFKEADTLGTELECFWALHRQEQLAAPRRIENLQDAVKQQSEKERMLQLRYENLLVEQENLRGFIHDHDAAAAKAAEEKEIAEKKAAEEKQAMEDMNTAEEARAAEEADAAKKREEEDKPMADQSDDKSVEGELAIINTLIIFCHEFMLPLPCFK